MVKEGFVRRKTMLSIIIKRKNMKKLLIIFLTFYSISISYGQGFQLNISPDTLYINQGDMANFNITATPTGGFNASIILSNTNMNCLTDLTFLPNIINPPYNGQLQIGSTSVLMPGDYKIIVKGENGSIVAFDSCYVHINYNGNMHWTVYNIFNSGLTYNTVSAIAVDNNDDIWVGTRYTSFYGDPPACLAKFNRQQWEVWTNSNHIITDYCGQILSQENFSILGYDGSINCIKIDKNNTKWIGTPNGLFKFNDTTWNAYLNNENVMALAIDSNNVLWAGTYGNGLVKFDGINWTTYTTSNSLLPSNDIYSLAIQTDTVIWVGTWGSGIGKYDGIFWTIYNTGNSGLTDNDIQCIEIDKQNNVWIAPESNGLCIYDGTTWSLINQNNSGLSSDCVKAIYVDQNNIKWIGAGGPNCGINGLNKFDDSNWQLFNSSNSGMPVNIFPSVPNDLVYAINKDAEETLWIGVWGGGLAAYNETDLAHDILLDVHENEANSYFDLTNIYPNPSSGNININTNKGLLNIRIINVSGQIVYNEIINDKNVMYRQINLNNAPRGLYFINITDKNKTITKKIIIE